MYWVITRDLIGTGDRVGFGRIPGTLGNGESRYGYVNLCDEKVKSWAQTLPVQIRLYDDDGELYYEGLATEAEFDAQDYFEGSDGVTYTMWRSSLGDWEVL